MGLELITTDRTESLFKGREWKYGVPTQSDVSDPMFQEAVRAERANAIIERGFESLIYTSWIHNRANDAVRMVDANTMLAEEILQIGMGIPIGAKGRRFTELFCGDEVARLALGLFEGFRGQLDLLDPREWARLEKRVGFFSMGLSQKRNMPVEWEKGTFEFSPGELIRHEIGEIGEGLRRIFESGDSGLDKARQVYAFLAEHKEAVDLLSTGLHYSEPGRTFNLAQEPGTEARLLFNINDRVAEGSDVCLRFDELVLKMKQLNGRITQFPSEYLFRDSEIMFGYALDSRLRAREMLAKKMVVANKLVVNGKVLEASGGDLVYSGVVPQWLADLMAREVSGVGGKVRPREPFLVEEMMVGRYRKLGFWNVMNAGNETVGWFLKTYKELVPFGSLRGEKEKLDNLLRIMRRRDWYKLHPQFWLDAVAAGIE